MRFCCCSIYLPRLSTTLNQVLLPSANSNVCLERYSESCCCWGSRGSTIRRKNLV